MRTDSEVNTKVRAVIKASAEAASIDQKKTAMNDEIVSQLAGLAVAIREKEAVDDYIRGGGNLASLEDFAEIQSAYPVFFCGVAGVNPMPLRQQQRYASQRIMQASLAPVAFSRTIGRHHHRCTITVTTTNRS